MQNNYAPPRTSVADVSRAGSGITDIMLAQLRGTRPWALLIAVILIILAVIMLLATLGMLLGGLAMRFSGESDTAPMAIFLVLGLFYGVGAITYMLMGIYLAKYSSAISTVMMTGHAQDMTQAMEQQRKFWKVAGIVTLVMMLFTLAWVGVLVAMPEMMASFNEMK